MIGDTKTLLRRGVYQVWIETFKGLKRLDRFNWECDNGPLPDGYFLNHLDGDSLNCEPDNLELKKNGYGLIWTPDKIRYIKRNKKKTDQQLADHFGVRMQQLRSIRKHYGIYKR